jgi:transposase-like protein
LTKRLVERAMEVEIIDHLGYERNEEPPGGTGNTRNGSTSKRLLTDHGEVAIDTPRDRVGSFDATNQRHRVGADLDRRAAYCGHLKTARRDVSGRLVGGDRAVLEAAQHF